jgi:hypothetical protein
MGGEDRSIETWSIPISASILSLFQRIKTDLERLNRLTTAVFARPVCDSAQSVDRPGRGEPFRGNVRILRNRRGAGIIFQRNGELAVKKWDLLVGRGHGVPTPQGRGDMPSNFLRRKGLEIGVRVCLGTGIGKREPSGLPVRRRGERAWADDRHRLSETEIHPGMGGIIPNGTDFAAAMGVAGNRCKIRDPKRQTCTRNIVLTS